MATISPGDISSTVLRRMKEGGFDFARAHPIEFYAIFPDEERARQAARMACTSAWAEGSLSPTTWLWARAITRPSRTMTAPKGPLRTGVSPC